MQSLVAPSRDGRDLDRLPSQFTQRLEHEVHTERQASDRRSQTVTLDEAVGEEGTDISARRRAPWTTAKSLGSSGQSWTGRWIMTVAPPAIIPTISAK